MSAVICADCGACMVVRKGRYGTFLGCERFPECRATHKADANGRPVGIPANAETRALRGWIMEAIRAGTIDKEVLPDRISRLTASQCREVLKSRREINDITEALDCPSERNVRIVRLDHPDPEAEAEAMGDLGLLESPKGT